MGAPYVLPAGSAVEFDHLTVDDGAVLEVGGMRLQVLHTPGHTPHHVSYAVSDSNEVSDPL